MNTLLFSNASAYDLARVACDKKQIVRTVGESSVTGFMCSCGTHMVVGTPHYLSPDDLEIS